MKEADSEANPLGCPVLHRIAHIVTNLIGEGGALEAGGTCILFRETWSNVKYDGEKKTEKLYRNNI